jgi:4-hydroxybenzoate polyprenyltransferase
MIMEKKIDTRLHSLDILFLLRPPMLIPVWTFFLAGYWRGRNIPLRDIPLFMRDSLVMDGRFWVSFIGYSLLLGSVYIVNQIVDAESDRINKKLFLIPLNIISVKSAIVISVILVFVTFSLAVLFRFGIVFEVFLLSSLVLGILYSVKPVRLKGRPGIDVLSNAVGYGFLAFGMGWLTSSPFSSRLLLCSLPYLFATATIFSASTILDREGDRRDGARTTAVRFGKSTVLAVCLVTLLLSFVSALFLFDVVIVVTSVLSLPLLFVALTGGKREHITLYMRGASYVFILLIGVLHLWYILLLVLVFGLSKFYYRFRFGVSYPQLLEKEGRRKDA